MPEVVLQYDSQICFAMSYHGTLKLLAKYKKCAVYLRKPRIVFVKKAEKELTQKHRS